MIYRVIALTKVLLALIQRPFGVFAQAHVDAELFIPLSSVVLAGKAVNTPHEIERRSERGPIFSSQLSLHQRMGHRVERGSLGDAQRFKVFFRCKAESGFLVIFPGEEIK